MASTLINPAYALYFGQGNFLPATINVWRLSLYNDGFELLALYARVMTWYAFSGPYVVLCPTSTSAYPISRHSFDHAHSTKYLPTKFGMCPPGSNPTPFPFVFFFKKIWRNEIIRFSRCHLLSSLSSQIVCWLLAIGCADVLAGHSVAKSCLF